jgi:Family of unknown function (DUF6009)
MLKLRTIPRDDGGIEILRILDDSILGRWTPSDPLSYEQSIVWLQPLAGLDFVRVAFIRNSKSRRGALSVKGSSMVLGYAKLTEDAPQDRETGRYTRRIFYLKEEDSLLNMNQFPQGSIDPRSILPSVAGESPSEDDGNRGYPWYVRRDELGLSSTLR